MALDLSNKTCIGCGEIKSITSFGRQGKYLRSRCRSCMRIYSKEIRDSMNAEQKAARSKYLKMKTYGLTSEEHDLLFDKNVSCPICLKVDPGKGGWHIDHDHETGKVRGLLCHSCNTALGKFKDNIASLQRAIVYLEESNGS